MLRNLVNKSLWDIFCYFFKKHKLGLLWLIFVSCIIGAFVSVDSYLLGKIIDKVEAIGDRGAEHIIEIMLLWIIVYGLWWQLVNIVNRLYDYLYLKIIPRLQGDIIDEVFYYTQYHSHKFFAEQLAGSISLKLSEASRSIELICAWISEKIIRKTAMVVCAICTMYLVNPIFAIIFLLWVVAFYGFSILFAKKISRYANEFSASKVLLSGNLVDSISNAWTVRVFNAQKREHQYIRRYIDKTVSSNQELQFYLTKIRLISGMLCSVMIVAMMYFLCMLRAKFVITVGDFVLILSLCISVINDTWDLSQEIGDVFEEIGAFSQALTLIKAHSMPYEHEEAEGRILNVVAGEIEFKNVSFRHKYDHDLFNDLSITIPAGQMVGVVGQSGSGKTTFANLIYRLYDVSAGTIYIDGQDISKVSQTSLRDQITVIPQEPLLFHRSIMENIRYGNPLATDEEVYMAAKRAHIHDAIISMEYGYDTMCGEKGGSLSGGQKQRIAIARAILKDTPIMILDEATSAQDASYEQAIQETLKELIHNKTVIVIAHQLSTLTGMDRILVFDNGTIVEDGTHLSLVDDENTLYSKLWRAHTRRVM